MNNIIYLLSYHAWNTYVNHLKIVSLYYKMKFVHYTFNDSTSEVTHFEINALVGDEWAGHYQRRGWDTWMFAVGKGTMFDRNYNIYNVIML